MRLRSSLTSLESGCSAISACASGLAWPIAVLVWLVGFLLFSLAEYSIHRWLLHNPKSFLFPLHDAHHRHPHQPASSFFLTGMVVLMLIWLFLRYALSFREAGFFISGFAAAYSYYGIFHHVEHTTRINQISLSLDAEDVGRAQCASSPAGDELRSDLIVLGPRLFKTYYKNRPRSVPRT